NGSARGRLYCKKNTPYVQLMTARGNIPEAKPKYEHTKSVRSPERRDGQAGCGARGSENSAPSGRYSQGAYICGGTARDREDDARGNYIGSGAAEILLLSAPQGYEALGAPG